MFDDIPQEEHPEKNGWWINELDSLSVYRQNNQLKNKQDYSDLVEAIKQEFMEQYKQTYHQ